MKTRRFIPFIILLAAAVTLVSPSCRKADFKRTEGLIWNTSYHITFNGPEELTDSILSVLDEVGKSLNVFDTTSLVSRVNRADTMLVDGHFVNVYETSLKMHDASDGLFDPTLSPLIKAWGFGPGHEITPDTAEIAKIMEFVGIRKTTLKGDTLIKSHPGITFNFSAVAKGYGCDAVAEMFRRNGVADYIVEIGGEIRMGAKSPSNQAWRVSIDTPEESDSTVVHKAAAILALSDAGMATSGNYRNFRKENGRTLGHTISPRTGRPETTDVLSATVIAPTAMEADAAATACMAAGSDLHISMKPENGIE